MEKEILAAYEAALGGEAGGLEVKARRKTEGDKQASSAPKPHWSPKLMVPKQISETRNPVFPSSR